VKRLGVLVLIFIAMPVLGLCGTVIQGVSLVNTPPVPPENSILPEIDHLPY
jgi:hypothetical protein